jgi:alkanesulfonate monooxygenase SsuD/methylene tetrahydromethanopterin reductase-like flavin-dependent oxidoreductase (luciferase family)
VATADGNYRFILGLGTSGPQVVEGLQGRSFRAPLTRLKETVEIIKLAFARERIEYHGKYHELPLPGGQGRALRLSQPGNSNIPIYLATLRPRPSNIPVPWPMDGSARRLQRNTRLRTSTICAGAPKGLGAA